MILTKMAASYWLPGFKNRENTLAGNIILVTDKKIDCLNLFTDQRKGSKFKDDVAVF